MIDLAAWRPSLAMLDSVIAEFEALGCLHHGVLVATDAQRPGRLATLVFVERHFARLPGVEAVIV